jgi:hypothetical protein
MILARISVKDPGPGFLRCGFEAKNSRIRLFRGALVVRVWIDRRQRFRHAVLLYYSLVIDKAFDFGILTFKLAPWRGKSLVCKVL